MTYMLSDRDHPSMNPSDSDPANPTMEIRWLTADEPDEFEAYEPLMRNRRRDPRTGLMVPPPHPRLSAQTRCLFAPVSSSAYRKPPNPVYSVDVAVLDLTKELGVVEIPEAYHYAAREWLRRATFRQLWDREETDHSLRRPGRPERADMLKYLDGKLRHALVELLDSGEWVDNPLEDVPAPPSIDISIRNPRERDMVLEEQTRQHHARYALEFALHDLNRKLMPFDLGQQKHMEFSSAAKHTKNMFGKPRRATPEQQGYRDNPLVQQYMAADPDTRTAMLRTNGGLQFLLQQAGYKP